MSVNEKREEDLAISSEDDEDLPWKQLSGKSELRVASKTTFSELDALLTLRDLKPL